MDQAYIKYKTKPMHILHNIIANVWNKVRQCVTGMGWHFTHGPLKLKRWNTSKQVVIRNGLTQ